jgi:predicted GNAT superfamily acetyltransferase
MIAPERVAAKAAVGGYVVGMYDLDTCRMIGVSLGYPDSQEPDVLYKDISGMVADARGRGRFESLLMFERAWGFRNGFETMQGSFDPLLRRNAWLNIERRAQHLTEYVVNKYGTPTSDSVNGRDDTDRFTVRWNLRSPEVIAALEGRRVAPDEAGLREEGARDLVSDDGEVITHATGHHAWLCATPEDITALRRTDPAAATRWRLAVRDVMVAAYDEGYRVTGATRSGRYVLGRP